MNLIKSMRVRQWTKNVFVLAALIFDKKLLDPHWLLVSLLGFVCFCFLSSSVYLFNDLMDIEADRNHPVKKDRPIASGALPVPVAWLPRSFSLVVQLPPPTFFLLVLEFA